MPKTLDMPAQPAWLRVNFTGRPVGVDRKANRLLGYVVAQEGPFKSDGRGEFDPQALQMILDLFRQKPNGLKARFEHPSASGDTLGKFLGRSVSPSLDRATNRAGQTVLAVRADLQFDATAFDTPNGNLAKYVMDLAESDPDAISSSLVLATDKVYRVNPDNTPMCDAAGDELPPLWRPTKLHASDIVDEGDAVDGLLSADGDWTRVALAKGAELLDKVFAGQPRDVILARGQAWLARYLDLRFGEAQAAAGAARPSLETRRLRLALKEKV